MKKIIYILLVLAFHFAKAQNPAPALPQSQAIVLKGGIFHLGNGQVLENGSIRFENGIITEIGSSVNESNCELINTNGKHIYPGLILPNNTVGLTEISAVRSTRDFQESGDFNPNVRSLIAYNTDSEIIPTMRSNGILLAQVTPQGGYISGTSSVMEMDGWNWEDAVNKADAGVHMNWVPTFTRDCSGGFPHGLKKNDKRDEEIQQLDNFFNEALAYSKQEGTKNRNLKFEAMKGLFDGSKTLFINVNFSKEIVESVLFAKKHQVKKIVIAGGSDAYEVVSFLKENNIPVILNEIHRLPERDEEDVYHPYKLPYLLNKAGVLVSLAFEDPTRARNLPFQAGTAIAYGVPKEEALKMITSNTAKILGIDDKVGVLEKGKQATLVVSNGDLLDMRSNAVIHAFIRGKKTDLDTRHKRLNKIYKDKYHLD